MINLIIFACIAVILAALFGGFMFFLVCCRAFVKILGGFITGELVWKKGGSE